MPKEVKLRAKELLRVANLSWLNLSQNLLKKKLKTLEKILKNWSEKPEKLCKKVLMLVLDMLLIVSVLDQEGKDKVMMQLTI